MILGGMWAVFVGYWILYAGVAKLGGDTGCTLGKAIRGQCSASSSGPGQGGPQRGRTSLETAQAARLRQLALVGPYVLSGAAA